MKVNEVFTSGLLLWPWGISSEKFSDEGFPGGAVVKNPPARVGDMNLISDLGRSHMPQGN